MTDSNNVTGAGVGRQGRDETDPVEIARIEAEIDQTRNAISGDLRTLGERLSPEHLKEEAKEVMTDAKNAAVETLQEAKMIATNTFREVKQDALDTVSEKVEEFRGSVLDVERQAVGFVRANAVPLALIGIGVAWFMSNRRSSPEARWEGDYAPRGAGRWSYPERTGSHTVGDARARASRAGNGASHLATEATQRARDWVGDVGQKADQVTGQARGFAERKLEDVRGAARSAEDQLGRATHDAREYVGRELRQARDFSRNASEAHPLAVGAAAVAAGVCVGLLLPETRRESGLFGAERERLLSSAKEAIQDFGQTAKDAAQNLGQTAKDAARDVKSSLGSVTG
jgi:ElaB/YqjD/DUF883 family membrane-anchored ribosome-binding protein